MEIRRVSITDIEKVKRIGERTFLETFSSGNSKENMNAYLEKEFSMETLKGELLDENSEFYFVELESQVVGYLKINFGKSQTEIKDDNALEIERIYVLRTFYGKGVGQLLFGKAMEIAKDRDVEYVWLGVWEHNPRAIRFYQKNGFSAFGKHIFKLGNDDQTDVLMKLELN
ncbi:GNAT family N-acetyltransferase [Flagellimonas allohymeniacidonis]|nr:GNAT family N-acetyltransferase [Allomuricauda hymeniacidonis]